MKILYSRYGQFFLAAAMLFLPLMAFQFAGGNPETNSARDWFLATYPNYTFKEVAIQPDWPNARVWYPNGKYTLIDVPLTNSDTWKYQISAWDNSGTGSIPALRNGSTRLVITKQPDGVYESFLFQTIGGNDFVSTYGHTRVTNSATNQLDNAFTGMMTYLKMDGTLHQGLYFENGSVAGYTTPNSGNAQGGAADRLELCFCTEWAISFPEAPAGSQNGPSGLDCTCYHISGGGSAVFLSGFGGEVTSQGGGGGTGPTASNGNQGFGPHPDEEEIGPNTCSLTNLTVFSPGPTVYFTIASAYTTIGAKLTNCKIGTITAKANISSTMFGGTIDEGMTTIIKTAWSNNTVTKRWSISTQNKVTVNFKYTIAGFQFTGSGTETNETSFSLAYN